MSVFDGFKPESVYRYFEEVSKIPRNSYHEEKISGYLVDFAKRRGLKYTQDEHYNVVIEKPASPGYEGRKKVILQGHMDMVCVASEGVVHDFLRDPIELVRDGDYVRANGTTLGSDDGNALAIILAVLENDDMPHPPLQAIFTSAEEVGMVGACRLDAGLIDGDYIIGLDYSQNTDILVSGAGALSCSVRIPVQTVPADASGLISYILTIKGLSGGHSGSQIILGRGNGIRLMGEALRTFKREFKDLRAASFTGGDKGNVIPPWSAAQITLDSKEKGAFEAAAKRFDETIRSEYALTDPGIKFTASQCESPKAVYAEQSLENLLDLLDLLPAGAQNYLDAERKHVKSSSNPGVLREDEKGLTLLIFSRANTEYQAEQLVRRISAAAGRCGAKCEWNYRLPAWQFDPKSEFVSKVRGVWEKTRGYRPELAVTHGGIELGIFVDKMKSRGRKLEAVGIGPHSADVHSPDERMEIATLGQTYELVAALLRYLD